MILPLSNRNGNSRARNNRITNPQRNGCVKRIVGRSRNSFEGNDPDDDDGGNDVCVVIVVLVVVLVVLCWLLGVVGTEFGYPQLERTSTVSWWTSAVSSPFVATAELGHHSGIDATDGNADIDNDAPLDLASLCFSCWLSCRHSHSTSDGTYIVLCLVVTFQNMQRWPIAMTTITATITTLTRMNGDDNDGTTHRLLLSSDSFCHLLLFPFFFLF